LQTQLLFTKNLLILDRDVVREDDRANIGAAALETRRLVGVLGLDATLLAPTLEEQLEARLMSACCVHCTSGATAAANRSSLDLTLRISKGYPQEPPVVELAQARGLTTGDLLVLEAQLGELASGAAVLGSCGYLLS